MPFKSDIIYVLGVLDNGALEHNEIIVLQARVKLTQLLVNYIYVLSTRDVHRRMISRDVIILFQMMSSDKMYIQSAHDTTILRVYRLFADELAM